jgi:hypothetical protein
MPKDTRDKVTLSPEAYKALEVEAMLHGDSLKDTASKLILKAACPKCKEILDIMARSPKGANEEEHKGTMEDGPKGQKAQVPDNLSTQEPEVIIAQGIDITRRIEPKIPKSVATVVDIPTTRPMPESTITQGPKGQKAQVPDSPRAKRRILSQDQNALQKIRDMWQAGEHNAAKIAKEIGYAKATTWENIKKMKAKGEIEETTK